MYLSHTLGATTAVFDDPNLMSSAGLVPVLALADSVGLRELARAVSLKKPWAAIWGSHAGRRPRDRGLTRGPTTLT